MASKAAASAQSKISELQKQTCEAIVNIFETGQVHGDYGKVTLLAGDSGHLTYGRSQTTLASGNLFLLIQSYCDTANAQSAEALRPYLDRLAARDLTLDQDSNLREQLKKAGDDPVMHDTQDQFFDRVYWTPAVQSAQNARLFTVLGTAVTYDSRIHGSWVVMRDKTNAAFGTAGEIGEEQWTARYVETRRDWLAANPDPLLRKCVYRMESFSQIIQQSKWQLELPLTVRGVTITPETLMGAPLRVSAESSTDRVLKLETPYMIGEDVRRVQIALTANGFAGDADGIYGVLTEARIRQFQLQNGLKADGMAGAATRAALGLD